MAKSPRFSIPSSSSTSGGLLGGFTFEHKTKYQFSPNFVIILSLIVVFIIFLLFRLN